jgi:spore germination protein GerM
MRARVLTVAAALGVALAAPAAAGTADVHVYFAFGEHGVAVHRSAPALSPARAAVTALLAGPTAAERRHGLTSSVPTGTRLLGLNVRNRIAAVDLSKRYGSGGGSLSMSVRLAQLVYTLTALRGVDHVNLLIEGRPVRVFGTEGLILRQPLSRSDYAEFVP